MPPRTPLAGRLADRVLADWALDSVLARGQTAGGAEIRCHFIVPAREDQPTLDYDLTWSEKSTDQTKNRGGPVWGAKIETRPLGIDGCGELVLRECAQAEYW